MKSHLNPEAGLHPMTMDPAEIAAAQRAAERSFAEFPYYQFRFGERGMRFGASDSAWLATLASTTRARALEQVQWLGIVLSSRGMPQILLERHLYVLHEELGDGRYANLGGGARELERLRTAVMPDRRFVQLAQSFEDEVEPVAPFPNMGLILVSAVIDEALGIDRAVAAVAGWATDPEKFPPAWVKAVTETIDRARRDRARER